MLKPSESQVRQILSDIKQIDNKIGDYVNHIGIGNSKTKVLLKNGVIIIDSNLFNDLFTANPPISGKELEKRYKEVAKTFIPNK